MTLTALMGDSDHISMRLLSWSLSSKAFISDRRAVSRRAGTGQARRRLAPKRQEGRGQLLVMCTRRAKAGNDDLWIDAEQEMEAFIPTEAITPADIGLSRQPSEAAPLGMTCYGCGAIQSFIRTVLRLHLSHQMQGKRRDRIALKRSFAGKLHPLPNQGERHDLTATQRRLGTKMLQFSR
jgi:hypothetical protein